MKRLILTLLAIGLTSHGSTSDACSCSLGEAVDKLKRFDSVFVDRAISVKRRFAWNRLGERRVDVEFDVEERWKGLTEDTILETVDNQSSCRGYWFSEGQRYLIYAERTRKGLDVRVCGGAVEAGDPEFQSEIDALRRATGVAPHTDDNEVTAARE